MPDEHDLFRRMEADARIDGPRVIKPGRKTSQEQLDRIVERANAWRKGRARPPQTWPG